MLKAVLLDIDGTLVRSNDEHAHAWSEALREFGFEVDWNQIRCWIGMGGDKILPRVDGRLSDKTEPGQSIATLRQELFLSKYVPHLEPQPGARDLLEAFKSRSLLRAAATSAKRQELEAILKAVKIADQIDVATTSDDAQRSKPDADIVESALGKSSLQTNEAVYLGDTPYDVEAAHRAGLAIVALRCGGWSDDELRGADAVYDTPRDLVRNIEACTLLRAMPL